VKRASPAVSTPRLTSSDDESDEDVDQPRKRARLDEGSIDRNRKVRDVEAFSQEEEGGFDMIHAYDIANNTLVEHDRDKYEAFFTALQGDEDECPIVELQYPTSLQTERYQLVRPKDASDFKPHDEIEQNMRLVAEYYLDSDSEETVTREYDGSGIVVQLRQQANRGLRKLVGAQTKYLELIRQFNDLVASKRSDGTIAEKVDQMQRVDLKLVEHIIKNQIYARTVSPQVNLVKDYEGFSDNVYGELLPKFLSQIFTETGLKSDQVFVDLGSGVGNCVLQAALETGCESWGCEMMDNPNTLAQLQAKEFPGRCRLWGLKPGDIHLLHGDFLENKEIREILKRADVVLINNQAFSPLLNDKLKYIFLDLKEGCQIVSLKPFRSPTHQIKPSNVNDSINVLTVVEKDRWSSMVSWTDDPGKWYHQRKDSSELRAFEERERKRVSRG
jgi:[histone H3]-lysine79 N-trimethyltransferase